MAPGGAAGLRLRTLPGPPEGWSDPPPVDLRALAFVSNRIHRPSRLTARRAMPVWARSSFSRSPARFPPGLVGCPNSVAEREPGSQFPSTLASGGSSGPVARAFVTILRTRLPVSRPVALDAVHANPVNRAIAWRRLSLVVVAVGVLPRPWSRVPLRPRPPVARRLGASELASRSDRNRFRLVVWVRFPLPSAARLPVQSSFRRLGLSAPVGMRSPVRGIHSRTENPRSSGIFEST